MSAPMEVLLSSESSGQMWSMCVWDPHTGSTLVTFKGGVIAHRCLCVLGNDYLLGASTVKPLIHVWSLHRKDQSQMKIVAPGKVSSLAVTHDGSYFVAAVNENIHVWQVCSGQIVATVCRHYQKINVIRFTDDDSHFISGGDDNIAIVWSLSSVLSSQHSKVNKPEPVYIWSSHSLPIMDIHVGAGSNRCRVVTASLDQSCKLWDLVSGDLLQTVVFPSSILSVSMDTSEYRLFAGGETGDIYCAFMYSQPVRDSQITSTEREITVFKGHSQKVTCLSISIDGTKLVSGSHDCTVKIWEVNSGQSVLTLNHKGQVNNVLMMMTPTALQSTDWTSQIPLPQFKSLREGDPDSVIMSTKIQYCKSGKVVEDEEQMISYDDNKEDRVDSMIKEKLRKSYLNKINDILT